MRIRSCYVLLIVIGGIGCDTAQTDYEQELVIESYAFPEGVLPDVKLSTTLPLDQPNGFGDPVPESKVDLRIFNGSVWVGYDSEAPGLFVAAREFFLEEGDTLQLEVRWNQRFAEATTMIPPAMKVESARVIPGEEAVSGLVLDSLFFDPLQVDGIRLDTLRTGATQGYIYLVEVTVHWRADYLIGDNKSDYWIRTQLSPEDFDRGRLDDYFLRPEQLFQERLVSRDEDGFYEWVGVYAIPVETAQDTLPEHRLRVALIRSTQAYAQFVSGTGSPRHREPSSNIQGALGIFAGVSVDTVTVTVN